MVTSLLEKFPTFDTILSGGRFVLIFSALGPSIYVARNPIPRSIPATAPASTVIKINLSWNRSSLGRKGFIRLD